MKPYQYPDKNDSLTCLYIDTKSNTDYWAKSEEHILQYVLEVLQTLSAPRVLDIGCGMGRLFSTFLPYCSSLTGVEPDITRYTQAVETAHYLADSRLHVLHGDIHTVATCSFDAVVCSHIWQHIPFSVIEDMLSQLSSMLPLGSVVFLTTTFTTNEQDIFSLEHKVGNEHMATRVSEAEFIEHFSDEGVLPVRIFSKNTIQHVCEKYGFSIVDYKGYHFDIQNMPKPYSTTFDDEKNVTKDLQYAKDVLYIISKDSYL